MQHSGNVRRARSAKRRRIRNAAVCTAAVFSVLLFCVIFLYGACIPKRFTGVIGAAAAEFSVDEDLLFAVIRAESGFDTAAESKAGAIGLMQIMPATARFIAQCMGEEPNVYDPADNVRMGAWYLAYLTEKFPSVTLRLAAYNAGEGTVLRWLAEGALHEESGADAIPYAETAKYVRRVKNFYKLYNFFYF